MEGKFQGGVRETFSKGVRDWNYLSKGVKASFPEGSYKLGHAFQWDHTVENCFPMGHFWYTPPPGIPAQKQI